MLASKLALEKFKGGHATLKRTKEESVVRLLQTLDVIGDRGHVVIRQLAGDRTHHLRCIVGTLARVETLQLGDDVFGMLTRQTRKLYGDAGTGRTVAGGTGRHIGISRVNDLLLAFPGILLAIVATSVFGVGLGVAAVALSISYIPYIARIVRSDALRQRRLPYIEAAWLRGVPTWWIWLKYLVPALWSVILAQIVLSFAYATIDVAAVSYLGLGVQAPTADWGTMVASGQEGVIQGHPLEALSAGACLVVMILSLGIVGDYLGGEADRGR